MEEQSINWGDVGVNDESDIETNDIAAFDRLIVAGVAPNLAAQRAKVDLSAETFSPWAAHLTAKDVATGHPLPGRLSYDVLAQIVGLARSSLTKRVKRYEDKQAETDAARATLGTSEVTAWADVGSPSTVVSETVPATPGEAPGLMTAGERLALRAEADEAIANCLRAEAKVWPWVTLIDLIEAECREAKQGGSHALALGAISGMITLRKAVWAPSSIEVAE